MMFSDNAPVSIAKNMRIVSILTFLAILAPFPDLKVVLFPFSVPSERFSADT
jgi:hypothetical protein